MRLCALLIIMLSSNAYIIRTLSLSHARTLHILRVFIARIRHYARILCGYYTCNVDSYVGRCARGAETFYCSTRCKVSWHRVINLPAGSLSRFTKQRNVTDWDGKKSDENDIKIKVEQVCVERHAYLHDAKATRSRSPMQKRLFSICAILPGN